MAVVQSIPINTTNLTFADWGIVQATNQVYVVEELCKPFVDSLGRAYITVAIFNLFYSFTWLWLKNRKDKILFEFSEEYANFKFKVSDIIFMLDIIFFMLNFFVIGYWLIFRYTDFVLDLPFIGWFM